MAFRTHLGRPMDLRRPSNRLITGLTLLAGAAAVAVWVSGGDVTTLWAPAHVFVVWALLREIDPDHDATALAAGLAAGLWVLAGLDVVGALAVGGLMVAARLVTNSTGRRPLLVDLIAVGMGAAAISFTPTGWVAGFGLALAIYIDDRMSEEPTMAAVTTAILAGVGASAVATISGAFPREIPDIRPLFVVSVGVLALIAVLREPEPPATLVDSRRKRPIERSRLHASRSLVAVLIFVMGVFSGLDATATGVLIAALSLSLVSNELERVRRRRR